MRQDLKEQEKRWLGLCNGLRKFLSVIMGESGSSVFLDGEFEPFAVQLFALAQDCENRKGQELLVKLRDLVFKCAVGCIHTHEKVLAACAMCVRGEFGEVDMANEDQSACRASEHLATQIEVKFFLTNDFEKFNYVNGLEPSNSEHSLPSR